MATVSGKIFQVKDGTTNLFPRTVIEAVYGLDKTIADVKTWVGNNYQAKYVFTISGTSGATYNLATIATQAANGNTAYGWGNHANAGYARQQAENNLVHASNEITMVPSEFSGPLWFNYRTTGGTNGNITNYNFGNGNKSYAEVVASKFVVGGGTSAQFLKADGSVDSNTYLTTGAAASTYLPLTGGALSGRLEIQNGNGIDFRGSGGSILASELTANLYNGLQWNDQTHKRLVVSDKEYPSASAFNANDMVTNATTFYTSAGDVGSNATSWENFPTGVPSGGFSLLSVKEGGYRKQFYTYYSNNRLYMRGQWWGDSGRIWSNWVEFYTTANFNPSDYLPLAAQGATVYRTTSGPIVSFNNSKGANEEAYLILQSNSTSKAAVGWSTTFGAYIYNYPSAKYLGVKDDGTPHYHGYTLLHANNYTSFQGGYANVLRDVDYHDGSHRRAAGNVTFADGGLHYFLATGSMKDSGRPGRDGHIIHCAWDNSTWDTQMYIPDGGIATDDNAHVKVRGQDGQGSWNAWHTLYDDVNLDKSKIISIVGTFPEAYLGWGGRNLSASWQSPIDAALCDQLGANRFAFAKTAGIDVFYSRDSGATWTNYEADTGNKLDLTSGSTWLTVGKAGGSNPATTAYRLKIVMYANNCGIYTNLNKFIIGITTYGSDGCWCTLRGQTKANYNAGNDTWTTFANKETISGWPGKNVINTTTFTFGTNNDHFLRLEFTFGFDSGTPNSSYYGLTIQSIYAYGGVGWTEPSNMASTGHLYSWDYSQTAYFPSGIRPSVSGSSLGVSTNRWALYATSGDFSSTVSAKHAIYANRYNGQGNVAGASIVINKGGEYFGIGPSSTNVANLAFGTTSNETGTWNTIYGEVKSNGQMSLNKGLAVTGTAVVNGSTQITGKLILPKESGTSQLAWWNGTYRTWITYLSGVSGSTSPTGAAMTSGEVVTSWSMRSLIQNVTGYGWVWESCAESANAAPTIMMELSSNTGVLRVKGGIYSNGYVSALGTASSSDAKLKDDITTISYDRAKEVLSALNPREWTWNALTSKEGEGGAGMVAQEVIPILPDTVKEIGGNLTLEYNTLFAYGLAATKYMLPMVETHEEKIARLEKEVEELKRQLTN